MRGTVLIFHIMLHVFPLFPSTGYPAVTLCEIVKEGAGAPEHRALSPSLAPHLLNAHPWKMSLHLQNVLQALYCGCGLCNKAENGKNQILSVIWRTIQSDEG